MAPESLGDDERRAWRALCNAHASLASPFYSPGFVDAVSAAQPHVYVCVFGRSNGPVGFFPFQFASAWHRRLGVAERVGGGLSDYCGIIADPSVRITPRELLKLANLAHFSFDHLDEMQLGYGLTAHSGEIGRRIVLPDGGEAYWEALRRADPKFVADTERRQRQLVKTHGPLRLVFQDRSPRGALEHLVAEKRRQYSATGARDALGDPRTRRLLFELAERRDADCVGVLSILYAGDTWVASHFGLRHRDVLHYWFPVYNPDLRQAAPGRLLLRAIIAAAADEGIRVIDRGAGDSSAKRDFAGVTHRYLESSWYTASLQGLAWEAFLILRWRLNSQRRQRLQE